MPEPEAAPPTRPTGFDLLTTHRITLWNSRPALDPSSHRVECATSHHVHPAAGYFLSGDLAAPYSLPA